MTGVPSRMRPPNPSREQNYKIFYNSKREKRMTAREALSAVRKIEGDMPQKHVESSLPLLEVLPLLLEAPGRELGVMEDGNLIGKIDQTSLLEALGHLITPRDDSSIIEVECDPEQYSASRLAHAVEDADVHLVDLLSHPTPDGHIRVTLRIRCEDAEGAAHSLRRYGYDVVDVYQQSNLDHTAAYERILAVRALINV